MKKLGLKLIFITVLGVIIGRVAPVNILAIFKTISCNFFAFLSLFGGIMMFSSLTPEVKEYFEKSKEAKRSLLIKVLLSTIFIIILFVLFGYRDTPIFPDRKIGIYFLMKVTPIMNFTTAILLSFIVGYAAFLGNGYLDGILEDMKRGSGKIVEKFVFPVFFISIPGIVMNLQVDELFNNLVLNRSWMELLILLLFIVKTLCIIRRGYGGEESYHRLIYMKLFILVIACPLFRGEILTESLIPFIVYIFFLSFALLLVEDIPAIVLLGFFGEMGGVSLDTLGLVIILYFIFLPIEKGLMKIIRKNIFIDRKSSPL